MTMSAVVLGARPGSGNIGTTIADRLRSDGWKVAEDDCHRKDGTYCPPHQVHLRRHDACVITVGHTTLTPMREAKAIDIEEVLYGSLELPLQCARQYIQARGVETGPYHRGHIIFIGSYAHNHALTGCAAYCAAKAGLTHAVRELAWELTPDFFVNIVHPYHVPSTPMGKSVVEGMIANRRMSREEAEEYQRKDLRLPGHQTPDDIATVVAWLLDPIDGQAKAWMSGAGIEMYGGVR